MALPFLPARVIVGTSDRIDGGQNARHLSECHGVAKPSDKRRDGSRPISLLARVAKHFDRLKLDFSAAVVSVDDRAAILDTLCLGRFCDGAPNRPEHRFIANRIDLRRGNGCIRRSQSGTDRLHTLEHVPVSRRNRLRLLRRSDEYIDISVGAPAANRIGH
jgi:hypothetical protein